MDRDEARDALHALGAVKGQLAQRAHWSWRRHAAFGAVMGSLVASYALPPAGSMIVLALCLVSLGLIVALDRRRDGFFVNGYRKGRTRRITGLLLVVLFAALAGAVYGRERGWPWLPIVAGIATFAVATGASKAWERAYRAELEDQ